MCYQPIQIKNPNFNKGNPDEPQYILVNCRKCFECRQSRAKEWALRCAMEAKQYDKNCFITLTYEKSPVWLNKRDWQLFMKKFRKAVYPRKVKFFMCGEYGTKNYRPHYHAILFGYDFPDKYFWSKSSRGYPIFRSDTLDKIWQHGYTTVQDVTLQSCAYCALYSSPQKHEMPKHLQRSPEFNLMSRSLGVAGLMEKMGTYLMTDEIYFDGQKFQIPNLLLDKYFGEDKKNYVEYLRLKSARKKKFELSLDWRKDYTDDELWQTPYDQRKYLKENAKKRLTKVL